MKTMILTTAILMTLSNLAMAQGNSNSGKYECKLLLKDNAGAFSIEMDKKTLSVSPSAYIDLKGNKDELYRVSISTDVQLISILNLDLGNNTIDVNAVATTDVSMLTAVNTFWSYATTCRRLP